MMTHGYHVANMPRHFFSKVERKLNFTKTRQKNTFSKEIILLFYMKVASPFQPPIKKDRKKTSQSYFILYDDNVHDSEAGFDNLFRNLY